MIFVYSRAALAVEEAERRRFERDVEQASTALRALDKAIAELEGKTNVESVERLIRLIELRQGLCWERTGTGHATGSAGKRAKERTSLTTIFSECARIRV